MKIVIETLDGDMTCSSELKLVANWQEFKSILAEEDGLGLIIATDNGEVMIPWTAIKRIYELTPDLETQLF